MREGRIDSRANPRVKQWARLVKSARARRESGCFLVEGAVMLGEALGSGVPVRQVLLLDGVEIPPAWREEIARQGGEIIRISRPVRDLLSEVEAPQGVLAVCALPRGGADGLERARRVLLLDGVQDPGNLGTILRTADAFALDWVLCCGTADLFSPKVVRASMGAVFRQRAAVMERQAALAAVRRAGLPLYAAALHRDSRRVGQIDLSRCAVAIGNEAAGVSAPVLDACEGSIYIPMPGRAESLNAAVAAGIVMWEMIRGDGACR